MLRKLTLVLSGLLATSQAVAEDSIRRPWQLFQPPAVPVASTVPHSAVVRIHVDEGRTQTSGSGTLVAISGEQGLIVTNWHVVRDTKGRIDVIFPDGFRSVATLAKSDQDWDLAALLIWKPSVKPVSISHIAPQPGDTLTIAGYGADDYRAIQGKCTQYVSPSMKHPYEIVELSAQARQGDSGGPILNERGELAGVLFGASRGSTSGSYCGRVRWFLSSVWANLDATESPTPSNLPLIAFAPSESQTSKEPEPTLNLVPIVPPQDIEPFASVRQSEIDDARDAVTTNMSPPPLPSVSLTNAGPSWREWVGTTGWDQTKSLLAVFGLLAIWGQVARWMTD